MRYRTCLLAGAVGAVVASVLWVLLWVLVAFVGPIAMLSLRSQTGGSGGVGFVSIDSSSILMAGVVGFIAGGYWQFRRIANRVNAR